MTNAATTLVSMTVYYSHLGATDTWTSTVENNNDAIISELKKMTRDAYCFGADIVSFVDSTYECPEVRPAWVLSRMGIYYGPSFVYRYEDEENPRVYQGFDSITTAANALLEELETANDYPENCPIVEYKLIDEEGDEVTDKEMIRRLSYTPEEWAEVEHTERLLDVQWICRTSPSVFGKVSDEKMKRAMDKLNARRAWEL